MRWGGEGSKGRWRVGGGDIYVSSRKPANLVCYASLHAPSFRQQTMRVNLPLPDRRKRENFSLAYKKRIRTALPRHLSVLRRLRIQRGASPTMFSKVSVRTRGRKILFRRVPVFNSSWTLSRLAATWTRTIFLNLHCRNKTVKNYNNT